jgi:hypothetical protein
MSILTIFLLFLGILLVVGVPWFQRRREQRVVAAEPKIIKILVDNQDKEMHAMDIIQHPDISMADVDVYEALDRLKYKGFVCVHEKRTAHDIVRKVYLITEAGRRSILP